MVDQVRGEPSQSRLNPVRRRCDSGEPGLCADVQGEPILGAGGLSPLKSLPTFSWCVLARELGVGVGVASRAATWMDAQDGAGWTATDSRVNVTLRRLLSFPVGITAYPCSAADTCARRADTPANRFSWVSFAQPSAPTDTVQHSSQPFAH